MAPSTPTPTPIPTPASVPATALPIIDLSRYTHPSSLADKALLITEVRTACQNFGFFQVKNHGVPLPLQKTFLKSLGTFFAQPKEEKVKLSFLKNPGRRGYEASGDSLRDGDRLPDSKEAFYIGREEPVVEPPGFHCPNLWPDLPSSQFRDPVWSYYNSTSTLGRTIWEIILLGLGHPISLLEDFTKKPVVMMKMIRYPPFTKTLPGQFGVGAHTDFGGVTVLLQEPGKEGLEVWDDCQEKWLPVPSVEDVYVINMGDMIQKWSGGVYKSAKHRVINKSDNERLSCATFWHGDLEAKNPLDPEDENRETVGELLIKRFGRQFSLPKNYTGTPKMAVSTVGA